MFHYHTKKTLQSQTIVRVQPLSGTYPVWKYRGETLAVLLERFRSEHALGAEAKLTYAGRLDPLAEGIVLVLAGESRFEKDALLGLPKSYVVDVVLGVATDTGDPLGLITETSLSPVDQDSIAPIVESMEEIRELPYPMYSSVPVRGKPLFMYAREGKQVDVPKKAVTIYRATLVSVTYESLAQLAKDSIRDISTVAGDFRQAETIVKWSAVRDQTDHTVSLIRLEIEASSGTYMRSLATWLGEQLRVPALAYRIIRTRIGEHTLEKE